MFITYKINIKNILNKSNIIYIISILLLLVVLLVGKNINGSKCWLDFYIFNIQPSEICKLALSFYLATFIKRKHNLFKSILITTIPIILVFLEPDTGAIINYIIILLIFITIINKNKKYLYITYILPIILFISFIIIYFYNQDLIINIFGTNMFYRMDRIINFANNTSYQLENALTTIGNATFLGTGLNKILLYIPEAPTDFIFAFSIGNFGILSAILILLSYLIIDLYLINKINNINNKEYIFIINTFIYVFIFHQLYNIFMNIGLFPIMGIPLPFLSYGGSNLIINYIYLGIIFNILKNKNIY